uniref:FLYWCH-type domain-containing protein n=1 Tax=Meloidogyne hapla TaxID=6305 RepID=A0A1I8BES5_MELHA
MNKMPPDEKEKLEKENFLIFKKEALAYECKACRADGESFMILTPRLGEINKHIKIERHKDAIKRKSFWSEPFQQYVRGGSGYEAQHTHDYEPINLTGNPATNTSTTKKLVRSKTVTHDEYTYNKKIRQDEEETYLRCMKYRKDGKGCNGKLKVYKDGRKELNVKHNHLPEKTFSKYAAKYIKSTQEKDVLVDKDFNEYVLQNEIDGTNYWLCRKNQKGVDNSCKGRAITKENIVIKAAGHTCLPKTNEEIVQLIKKIKELTEETAGAQHVGGCSSSGAHQTQDDPIDYPTSFWSEPFQQYVRGGSGYEAQHTHDYEPINLT